MPFREVVETLGHLETLLDEELQRGLAQTGHLTALDAEATLGYAQARVTFTTRLAGLEAVLGTRVAESARALGLASYEVTEICVRYPAQGQKLAAALAAVRRAADAVRRQDALNRLLAGRAHACVGGWLRALTGAPNAYDRQGAAPALPSFATSVRVA